MREKNILRKIKIATLFLLIFASGCAFYWLEDRPTRRATQEEVDMFYNAISTNNSTRCYGFDLKSEKRRIGFFSTEPTFLLRNHCFYTIAIETKNPKLCEEMKDVLKDEETFIAHKEACIQKASR